MWFDIFTIWDKIKIISNESVLFKYSRINLHGHLNSVYHNYWLPIWHGWAWLGSDSQFYIFKDTRGKILSCVDGAID